MSENDDRKRYAREFEDEVRYDDEITAEEIDDQQNKLDVDILDNKDEINTVAFKGCSEGISEKLRMFSEFEIKGVGLMPQVENSDETQKNCDKFPDAEVPTTEVSQLQLYDLAKKTA